MSITSEEYKKLLDFSTFINEDYMRFIKNVGYGMGLFFDFPLTVYTIFDTDHKGNVSIDHVEGHTVYPEGLRQYREGMWQSDLFVRRVAGIKQGSMQNPVLTITDIASYDEFYDTDYGRYLKKINTPYQAILRGMCGRLFPLHVLSVFKTLEQGEFTEHEKELLAVIDRIFSESVDHYLTYMSGREFKDFLKEETESYEHNLAIINERGEMVFCNSGFSSMASDCFNVRDTGSIIKYIREEYTARNSKELFRSSRPESMEINGFRLNFTERSYNEEIQKKRFIFVDIEKIAEDNKIVSVAENNTKDEDLLKLVAKYGLTQREAEIAIMLASGMNNSQMADHFHISLPTVKFHIQNIRRKMNVSGRAEIMAYVLGVRQ